MSEPLNAAQEKHRSLTMPKQDLEKAISSAREMQQKGARISVQSGRPTAPHHVKVQTDSTDNQRERLRKLDDQPRAPASQPRTDTALTPAQVRMQSYTHPQASTQTKGEPAREQSGQLMAPQTPKVERSDNRGQHR